MNTDKLLKLQDEDGSILIYFLFALVIIASIASVAGLAMNAVGLAHRRMDMINATQLAEGGAALACMELEKAYTNSTTTFAASLVANAAGAYTLKTNLGGGTQKVFQRTVNAPFTNGHSATVQIWVTNNATTPVTAKVVGTSTVGNVTQSATVQLTMKFGYSAAILSDSAGTTSSTISKAVGKQGNVVIDGNNNSTTIIDGGEGYAILANGRANIDSTYAKIPANSISMTNFGTANEVPDYTDPGSTNQLFDFSRFIAVADLTPSGPSPSGNNHFTNLAGFLKYLSNAPAGTFLEGVVVVNIRKADFTTYGSGITPALVKNKAINVRGTLLFNFAADVLASDYFMNSAVMNINPANLSGLNATNPATYTSGYPPIYTVSNKIPANVDITSKGFSNFSVSDDLPALMYNTGIFDIHGAANVCGVVYTPSFIEIENLNNNVQYFRGSLISGGGVIIDNHWAAGAKSIVSYDPAALDYLATSGTKGKLVKPIFWQ